MSPDVEGLFSYALRIAGNTVWEVELDAMNWNTRENANTTVD